MTSTLPQRQRSSTSASAAPSRTAYSSSIEIRQLLDTLSALSASSHDSRDPDFSDVIAQLDAIRAYIADSDDEARARDAFRNAHGFQSLLDTLRAASGYYHPTHRSTEEKQTLFALVRAILAVLSEAFQQHNGNQQYFKRRVDGDGWASLEQALASIGVGDREVDDWSTRQLLGLLLAFGVNDLTLSDLFEKLQTTISHVYNNKDVAPTKEPELNGLQKNQGSDLTTLLDSELQERLPKLPIIAYPDIMSTIIGFWKVLPRGKTVEGDTVALMVIKTLHQLSGVSRFNLLALHTSGTLSVLLPLAFEHNSILSPAEVPVVTKFCESLMALGISNLDDARYLVRCPSEKGHEFLLQEMKANHDPPHVQFDLSLHGFSTIELPTLGRPFPPPSAILGYTFTAWIYIDRFDSSAHTTIFGAFDSTQTCFVLAYLEKDTHNFILQTSITSTRPSVRFKSTRFHERKWYHIGIVHRRPRTMVSSKAALYVDGEFAEQVKCSYPAAPPPLPASNESFASFSSSSARPNPVQAFVGTPRDLSPRLGRGAVNSKWSLASAHLFEDVLSDDLIAVHYRLGPRYCGNFQDCLGSFQTYENSAVLGMRNEMLHPGKDEKSDISTATREKASTIMPENRIILSVLPGAILQNDELDLRGDSLLLPRLSRNALGGLSRLTRNGSTSIALNAAVPSINEALVKMHGTAILSGDPVVVVPQSLDDAMWRLGGCSAVGLKMVEDAHSREAIVRAVETLLGSIKGSWRNSEAMERDNGYAVLGALLRGKLGAGTVIYSQDRGDFNGQALSLEEREKMSFELLSLVLGFVGYDHVHPEESTIQNPLAYRILLVDFDMWRKAAPITQKLYYKQFETFGVKSKYHQWNSKRLLRMRIVKKFLDAMKSESFSHEVFPSFLEAFTSLVKCNMTAEVYRSLALFVTYALHKPNSPSSRTPRPRSAIVPLRGQLSVRKPSRPTVSTTFSSNSSNQIVSKKQLGIKILEMYTGLICVQGSTTSVRKFAKTVTNKWLLHLLTEDEPQVVVLATKIIARLLVVHGSGYVNKFATKTGGFIIMRHRLRRWWDLPTLWPLCFGILFGQDVAQIDYDKPFDLYSLLEIFNTSKVIYPGVLPIIISMLEQGLKTILRNQDDPDSPIAGRNNGDDLNLTSPSPLTPTRPRSMSLEKELESRQSNESRKQRLGGQATVLHTVIRFLADIHGKSQDFRDFTVNSDYIRLLLAVLFPIIVSADSVSPETELNSRDSALTFEGDDVIIRPINGSSSTPSPIIRTSNVETDLSSSPPNPRAKPLRRGSSFILLTSAGAQPEFSPSSAKLSLLMSPKKRVAAQKISNALLEGMLELVVGVFIDQIMERKDFTGFGLFLKVPPGFQEHQAYFESYLLRNSISQLLNTIQLDQKTIWEPRIITNMARFTSHLGESVYEGWFLSGAEPVIDFTGTLLEHLQRPDIAKMKNVRLCSQHVQSIRSVFFRVVLLRLSELDDIKVSEVEALNFMQKLVYWQTVVLSSEVSEDLLKLVCYQLYTKLVDRRQSIRLLAADLWRILLVQKPDETSSILNHAMSQEQRSLTFGFRKLTELDNETFVQWVDGHRSELDALFFGAMCHTWEEFVNVENHKTEEAAKTRIGRRRERLKQWHSEDLNNEDILFRHELAANLWGKNIYSVEHNKYQKAMQDQQDTFTFLASIYKKIDRDLQRPCAVFDKSEPLKWQLDRTEGRNRMRLRMMPDHDPKEYDYQPKRKATESYSNGLKLDTKSTPLIAGSSVATPVTTASPTVIGADGADQRSRSVSINEPGKVPEGLGDNTLDAEDFELVDDPNEGNDGEEGYEDKNRKVMRSLDRGDSVQQVYNISRILGLEACEGLLILGKDSLYLMDSFFQRSDGEIVNVWQAPAEERDPYLQIISGQNPNEKKPQTRADQESRSWKWQDVISISKRRFLFRDVAVEVFFTDGRSYLLTAMSPVLRDELYSKVLLKAPHTSGASSLPNPEDTWRLEALKVTEEAPPTFGSNLGNKFGSIFHSSAWNPAMKRWVKGELSNFHYLMLVNTMAGRTFNDLTQYPVFPWVIADYTSDELDLENPATFRDLTKPMGAQHASREKTFIERYESFAEMVGHNEPSFHYGTHYSSAMIVTSYLIRLQPFVKSYLLLQGGNFDHPDRLFYSIEKAWNSASRENMTDVRELIPEFFYLPEFLTNGNGFNFGLRQGDGGAIDTVELPPWAKGDPKIFIAKHREALESPYVSRHLHQWIDLIFGSKQRGEAAVQATNVFHHLSYHGAKDLENIDDPHERKSTISIIHNFGQTPHQVFHRLHQPREEPRFKTKRLDTAAESLTRLPFPLLDTKDRVTSIIYSAKLDRLMCATSFKLNMPPNFDKYMEWGFSDNSIRFFTSDSKRLAGLFENTHQGQLSAATFADSKTLITAGVDCVISVWNVVPSSARTLELAPKQSLFGHKKPVTILAVAKSFSTILSASTDGQVLLWDLNRLELIRKLTIGRPVECAAINDVTGDIMLCRNQKIALFTLNGDLILDQNVCLDSSDDYILSCAFYEGSGNEWLEEELIFTGHKRGVAKVWKKTVHKGKWVLELVKHLDHVDARDESKGNQDAGITCISAMAQVVYTGDEDGRVYEWDCVQRER